MENDPVRHLNDEEGKVDKFCDTERYQMSNHGAHQAICKRTSQAAWTKIVPREYRPGSARLFSTQTSTWLQIRVVN